MAETGLNRSARQAREKLLDWIKHHSEQSGHRLPSERELMALFDLSRGAIRSALEQLTTEGAIRSISPRIRVVEGYREARRPATTNIVAVLSGLVLPEDPETVPSSHISPQQLLGIIFALHNNHHQPLILRPSPDVDIVLRQISQSKAANVVLLNDVFKEETRPDIYTLIKKLHSPVCSFVDSLPSEDIGSLPGTKIAGDHAQGCAQLVRHLVARGCRRILRVWSANAGRADSFWLQERNRGYEEACREAGIELLEPVLIPALNDAKNYEEFDAQVKVYTGFLLEHLGKPNESLTGLLGMNDGVFHFIAAACRRLGLEPGHDVLITGYDNYWHSLINQRLWEPAIPEATVSLSYHRAGRLLVESLKSNMSQAHNRPHENEILRYEHTLCHPRT